MSNLFILLLIIFILSLILYFRSQVVSKPKTVDESPQHFDKQMHIVLLYSITCPHCVSFLPKYKSIQSKYGDISFSAVEKNDDLMSQYTNEIEGFPTVLIIKDNVVHSKIVGDVASNELESAIEESL